MIPSHLQQLVEKEAWQLADHDCWPGHCDQHHGFLLRFGAQLLAAAEREPQGWQPIDTAPKDGTEILLVEIHNGCYGTIEHGAWEFIERSEWDGAKVYGWVSDTGRIEEPTHWMPAISLPSSPLEGK